MDMPAVNGRIWEKRDKNFNPVITRRAKSIKVSTMWIPGIQINQMTESDHEKPKETESYDLDQIVLPFTKDYNMMLYELHYGSTCHLHSLLHCLLDCHHKAFLE